MEVANSLILFALGFYVLIKGAQILIRGAVSLARVFDVSNWFIGAFVISVGTSIPELSVNIASTFTGNNVGLATIIGSNTFNIFVILGFSAIFYPIVMRREWVVKDAFFNIVFIFIATVMILFSVAGDSFSGITRAEGFILLSIFFIWVWFLFHRKSSVEEETDIEVVTIFTATVMVVLGIVGVFFGGQWVVDGAGIIALLLGAEPAFVGLTLVAIGTSLPELTVSLVALSKGSTSIAIGNILGSSIFSFLGVLGITALINPIVVLPGIQFDIFVVLTAAVLFFTLMFVGRRYTLSRMEGVLFLVLYFLYIISLIFRVM